MPKPRDTAHFRTACRTLTMSSAERRTIVSDLITCLPVAIRFGNRTAQRSHAFFDVEGGADAFHLQPELDQSDGDRWLHSNYNRVGIQQAGHTRNAGEHAADEGVDHF